MRKSWQLGPQCAYFVARDIVAISAEYRLAKTWNDTDRMYQRWKVGDSLIRKHASEIGIDPEKVIVERLSGGHIAA